MAVRPTLTVIPARLALSAVSAMFVVSGALKVWAPDRFLYDVQAFQLVPYPLAYATALILPWLEVVVGLGLWWRPWRAASLAWGIALMAVFLVALGWSGARGLDLDCGCFGDWLVFPSLGWHLAFNSLMVLLQAWLMWRELPHPAAPAQSPALPAEG